MHKKAPIVAEGGNLKTQNVKQSIHNIHTDIQVVKSHTPQPPQVNIQNIPDELKALDIWVTWKYERIADSDKFTKVPYQANLRTKAQSTNHQTWDSFENVLKAYETGACAGIGVFNSYLDKYDPKTGEKLRDGHTIALENFIQGDIDHCFKTDGTLTSLAQDILNLLGAAYVEVSPSGTGIRFLCRADVDLKYKKNTELGLELYQHGRYVTITGNVLDNSVSEILDKTVEVQAIYDKYLRKEEKKQQTQQADVQALDLSDFDLLQKMFESSNGSKIKSLYEGSWQTLGYPSQSEADFALLSHLAFWTQKNASTMDSLFRQSGLMRPKWNRQTGHDTYGNRQISEAISNCVDVYNPNHHKRLVTHPTPKPDSVAKNVPPEIYETWMDSVDNIELISERYFTKEIIAEHIEDGTVLMAMGSYGTAKSTATAKYLSEHNQELLVTTPLQALTLGMSKKFNVDHYRDDEYRINGGYKTMHDYDGVYAENGSRGLAITVNSLPRLSDSSTNVLPTKTFNTIFADEFDQQIDRLMSKDVTNAADIYDMQKYQIHKSGQVVLASADFDSASIEMVKQSTNKPIKLLINLFKPEIGREALIVKDHRQIRSMVIESIRKGEPTVLYSNSNTFLKSIKIYLDKEFPDKKLLLVNKDSKNNNAEKRFILYPNTECEKYDGIFISPTLHTGFDVAADHRFKNVFAYFCATSSEPKAAMQQLHRFREIDKFVIAVDERKEYEEINVDLIKQELVEKKEYRDKYSAIDTEGRRVFRDKDFEALCAHILSNERKARRDYRGTFLKRLATTGRNISISDRETTNEEKELHKRIVEDGLKAHIETLSGARDLSGKVEYNRLRKKSIISPEDRAAMDRYLILSEFHTDIEELDVEYVHELIKYETKHKIIKKLKGLVLARQKDNVLLSIVTDDELLEGEQSSKLGVAEIKLTNFGLQRELVKTVLEAANIDPSTMLQTEPYNRESVSNYFTDNYEKLKEFKSIVKVPRKNKLIGSEACRWLADKLNGLGIKTKRTGKRELGNYTTTYHHNQYLELKEAMLKPFIEANKEKYETVDKELNLLPPIAFAPTPINTGRNELEGDVTDGYVFYRNRSQSVTPLRPVSDEHREFFCVKKVFSETLSPFQNIEGIPLVFNTLKDEVIQEPIPYTYGTDNPMRNKALRVRGIGSNFLSQLPLTRKLGGVSYG